MVAPAAADLAERRQRYADLKREQADTLQFQKQKRLFAGLAAGIPAQKDVPLLVKDLVSTARRLNLAVEAVNSDIPTIGAGGLAMLTFTIPAAGAYGDVKRFIHEVETSDRLVGIQDIRFGADKGQVKFQMKLVTYIREE
jgi:Tfp pilus assembly protein PilO